jgi:hypothetical protein
MERMNSKNTPTIKQLLSQPSDPIEAQPALRTIWNTNCGGYPAGELIAVPATGAKSTAKVAKKASKVPAKAS